MSWRTVIISSTAKLDYQMGYLVIRKEEAIKIHLSEIEILMIESTAVSLTAALLCELTKKKIKVIFCDEKRNPSSELIGYYGAHDTSLKVRSLTVAVMILFIGFELAKSSLEKVLHPVTVEFSLLSMIVLIASILVKAEMMIFNTRMGKRIDSTTLLATAADSRNDVLTTTAVLIAALVEHATGWKVDGIMGILVAVFILWSGIGLARDTISRFSGRCEIRLSKRTDTGDHDVSDGTWLS